MANINNDNLEQYWFEGEPFGSVNTSLDTGTEEFWFEGQPITFLLELSSPSSNVQGSFFPFFDTF
jgi:hypothetical protein